MKIKVLGSAIDGADHQFAASSVINDTVAIDAGAIGFSSLACQKKIRHVFITHSHLDHIASLPIFLDNIFEPGPDSVSVYGSPATLQTLRECFFNDKVWPDVLRLEEREGSSFVRLVAIDKERPIEVDRLKITPVALDHNVPTLGFLIDDGTSAVAMISDTGPTHRVWEVCNQCARLKAVFVESAFPNRMWQLAEKACHLTPKLLFEEQQKLNTDVPLIAVHIKPAFYDEVVGELRELNLPSLEVSASGREYSF